MSGNSTSLKDQTVWAGEEEDRRWDSSSGLPYLHLECSLIFQHPGFQVVRKRGQPPLGECCGRGAS